MFAFEKLGLDEFQLCAPTGKAARRMAEATGRETQTIHRMLGMGKAEISYSYANPLHANLIVVDEMSMVDISLFANLVSSVTKHCRLLLVGDQDQLASVGTGRVLQDLLEAGLPQVRLTQPQRQAASSLIIQSAHLINKGEFPPLADFGSKGNAWFTQVQSESEAKNQLVKIIELLKAKNFDFSKLRILSPVKKGECGVFNLNSVLQELINPPHPHKQETHWRSNIIREGDSLIQLKNDYTLDLMNGEEVKVESIREAQKEQEKEVWIDFFNEDGRTFEAPLSELEMQHSFALTIHKSQGSEYDVVVLFCLDSQLGFFSRKMLYTGLTRAKKLAIVIGSRSSLVRVIGRNQEVRRKTKLKSKIEK
ncbi:MAG TPA: AAA family ATPase [Pyrinomonadaceae bacterium]|nr:AAA family ATPase [Pyrinomonadaceae bacterium]